MLYDVVIVLFLESVVVVELSPVSSTQDAALELAELQYKSRVPKYVIVVVVFIVWFDMFAVDFEVDT